MRKILIMEDDRLIAELERDYLEANGFAVEIAFDGREGLRLAQTEEYALLLLDVMLPGIGGFEICREVRRSKNVPVVMVTARKDDVDKIRGLGLGADDYVVKPFSPSELVARCRAHIQIHERLSNGASAGAERPIEVKGLKILPLSRRVFVGGREVALARREYELLLFLASNPDIVFSRETLFERVWGEDPLGDAATVTVHVNRIRDKIEKDPSRPEISKRSGAPAIALRPARLKLRKKSLLFASGARRRKRKGSFYAAARDRV